MEAEALVTAPVILGAFLLAVVCGLLGYNLGRSREEARKHEALRDAESVSQATLVALRQENQDRLDVMAKAGANELRQLREDQLRQVEQIQQGHQTVVDSLKNAHRQDMEHIRQEHNTLVDSLNAGNSAAIRELESQRQAELKEVRRDRAESESALRDEHRRTVAELHAERVRDKAAIQALEQTLAELREEVKEAKMNNMFSMSRSGEKLIRVVRSVQELATELDETSRTVTGGDYSFFDQIKDQRDRDTVRRLTGAESWTVDQETATVVTAGAETGAEPASVADDDVTRSHPG
jgi:hypothetical protein